MPSNPQKKRGGIKKITPKQDAFARAIAKGKNQSDAFRSAYDTSRMKPETIHRSAKFLMDNPKIKTRIKELITPAVKKLELTAEYVLRNIIKIGEQCMEGENKEAQALKSQELLGKYLKLFTDKVDLGGQVDNPVQQDINVKGMDPKKLMEIIRGKTGA